MPKTTKKTRNITGLIRPGVRRLAAYHVDGTPVRIKLDAMENPFPLPAPVRREIADALRKTAVNLYPDPSAAALRKAIASMWNMKPDLMLLGNGSDELIQAVVLAFGGPVLVPTPSFAMYEITARALSQDVVTVPLTKEFDLDADAVIREARRSKARVVFLACPNNPTGNRYSDQAVRKVLETLPAAVVVDEAYFSFSGKTYLPLMKQYPNMIILRTLSKIGFAGLRVGVLTAAREVVAELNKIRLPYNINTLSQTAAVTALSHRDVVDRQISRLISEREKLYNALSRIQGVAVYPSETNFLLLRTATDATKVQRALRKAGILVKDLNRPGPLRNCLRVTVGTPGENREFLKTFKSLLDKD